MREIAIEKAELPLIFNQAKVIELSVAEIRDGGDQFINDIEYILDDAQGDVFTNQKDVAFIVIKVVR